MELAKANKARSSWWGIKSSGVGTVGAAVLGGITLGPVGAVAGGSIGGKRYVFHSDQFLYHLLRREPNNNAREAPTGSWMWLLFKLQYFLNQYGTGSILCTGAAALIAGNSVRRRHDNKMNAIVEDMSRTDRRPKAQTSSSSRSSRQPSRGINDAPTRIYMSTRMPFL